MAVLSEVPLFEIIQVVSFGVLSEGTATWNEGVGKLSKFIISVGLFSVLCDKKGDFEPPCCKIGSIMTCVSSLFCFPPLLPWSHSGSSFVVGSALSQIKRVQVCPIVKTERGC